MDDAPPPQPPEVIRVLAEELAAARQEFLTALAAVDPALLKTPGMVGEWSAREVVAHMGYWAGHAADAIHYAEEGRLDEFGQDDPSGVDERNEVVARVARETDMATVEAREEAAFNAFLSRILTTDPEWLSERDPDGDTLDEIIHYDGADHYREHAQDIRAWFTGPEGESPDESDDEAHDEAESTDD
jgi:hypothetical protein